MKVDTERETHMVRSGRTEEISEVARANIAELLANPDRKIDTSDIPEWTDEQWKNAVRGKFYRPRRRR